MPLRPGMTVALLSVATVLLGTGVARAADHAVTASGTDFSPPTLSITQGDRVIWTNGGGSHNVMFNTGPAFDMPANPSSSWGGTITRTFDTVGTFSYLCEAHAGLGMTGTITVSASGTPPPPPPPPGTPPPGGQPPPPGGDPTPPDPIPGGPALPLLKVTLKVSDATPLFGTRIRLSGEVRPARDGRTVKIQRRGRGGAYRTIATARLRDAGAAKSRFSLRLKLNADAVLRARVAGDDQYAAGVSKTKSIDAHRR
jgi:plastocyanin